MGNTKEFHFYTKAELARLLGIKAKNIVELLEHIKKVPLSSIYYHTHRFIHQHHYLSPEPPNDFAYWITNILGIQELGEAMASIDVASFKNMEDLRNEFINTLQKYITNKKVVIDAPQGYEFHFMSCFTVVMPTNYIAKNLIEFVQILNKISINSLCFHIFDARLRLQKEEDDFSAWFKSIGKNGLAHQISRLDPYNITLEGLRRKIINLVENYAKS